MDHRAAITPTAADQEDPASTTTVQIDRRRLELRRTLRKAAGTGLLATLLVAAALPLSAGAAQAATGTVGFHSTSTESGPATTCQPDFINVRMPWMKAVNTTSGIDLQNVTYRPDLYRWQPDSTGRWVWVLVKYGTWATPLLQDDNGSVIRMDSTQTRTFPIPSGGYYKVALDYYWYATTRVGSGSDRLWSSHQDFFEDAVSYCTY